jgi:hypothetical protein
MSSKDKWSKGIKEEIIDMKLEITALKAQIKAMGAPVPEAKAMRGSNPYRNIYGNESIFDRGSIWKDQNSKDYIDGMVKATYSIREASTAMRGYMMLLDQAGLSRDQKKMVKDVENGMMMIMKMATTLQYIIKLQQLAAASEFGPVGYIYMIMIGGSMAASIAYGSKLTGGSV